MTTKLSRRELLQQYFQIPMGMASMAALASCSRGPSTAAESNPDAGAKTASGACADVETMSDSDRPLRQSLHYTEVSPDQNTVCAKCSFFHAGEGASGCGTCDIYSGGPVNSHGHCDSWSKRAA